MSEFPDMSVAFEIEAPAKTNLWLKILGKREDGFHDLHTRMVALSLVDRLKLKWREDNDLVLHMFHHLDLQLLYNFLYTILNNMFHNF